MHVLAFIFTLVCVQQVVVVAQEEVASNVIVFSVNTGVGLIYLLLLIFFSLTFGTPIVRWVYVNYLSGLIHKADKMVTRAQRNFSERMSDIHQTVAQGIRTER